MKLPWFFVPREFRFSILRWRIEGIYIFGMEESYGYLSNSYFRDKDAADGAVLICEMFAYYKTQGISLIDKLEELYKKYGYSLHFYEFEGSAGFAKMQVECYHVSRVVKRPKV